MVERSFKFCYDLKHLPGQKTQMLKKLEDWAVEPEGVLHFALYRFLVV